MLFLVTLVKHRHRLTDACNRIPRIEHKTGNLFLFPISSLSLPIRTTAIEKVYAQMQSIPVGWRINYSRKTRENNSGEYGVLGTEQERGIRLTLWRVRLFFLKYTLLAVVYLMYLVSLMRTLTVSARLGRILNL